MISIRHIATAAVGLMLLMPTTAFAHAKWGDGKASYYQSRHVDGDRVKARHDQDYRKRHRYSQDKYRRRANERREAWRDYRYNYPRDLHDRRDYRKGFRESYYDRHEKRRKYRERLRARDRYHEGRKDWRDSDHDGIKREARGDDTERQRRRDRVDARQRDQERLGRRR